MKADMRAQPTVKGPRLLTGLWFWRHVCTVAKIHESHSGKLVLFQDDIVVFSVPVVFASKAPCTGNGDPLVKHGNAAGGLHGSALRVVLSASMDSVTPLGKGGAIASETRLAMNADKPTEHDNIIAIAEKEIDLQAVNDELVTLEKDIATARDRHNWFLKELGLPLLP
jgi:hypothetical protein